MVFVSTPIYVDTDAGRLGATLTENGSSVFVWRSHGAALGYYNIERFEGRKLTPQTLRQLFTNPTRERANDERIH